MTNEKDSKVERQPPKPKSGFRNARQNAGMAVKRSKESFRLKSWRRNVTLSSGLKRTKKKWMHVAKFIVPEY